MTTSSRDRISVDLQGLKASLCERAQATGILPSAFIREALADALGQPVAQVFSERCARGASGALAEPGCHCA